MVPQHSQEGNMTRTDIESTTAATEGLQNTRIVFGSQLVDKNSSTPYSDATKVSLNFSNIFFSKTGKKTDRVPSVFFRVCLTNFRVTGKFLKICRSTWGDSDYVSPNLTS